MFSVTNVCRSGQSRSVFARSVSGAKAIAAAFRNDSRAPWEDRSPGLYGNRHKTEDEYEVFLWRNMDDPQQELLIESVHVHEHATAAASVLRF